MMRQFGAWGGAGGPPPLPPASSVPVNVQTDGVWDFVSHLVMTYHPHQECCETIQSNVSLVTGDEETSCSSSLGGRGGCSGGAGGGGSSVRHSSPAASSSGESSSSDAESSSSSSSSSGSDSSAALAAACSLQVINEEDLAAILPEHQPYTAGFTDFGADGQSQNPDVKAVQENGDGSSSEMELPPQLVNAAIQRATADSSSSENESTSQEMSHPSATHYASSLLQEFVAQTQLLSHTTPIAAVTNMTKVQGLGDCVLTQSCPISEIDQMEPNFLSSEHLTVPDQQLSPQQTEELSQINRDLAEISSVTDSVEILIQNPPSLDDCVDNSDFMTLDITTSSADIVARNVTGGDLEASDASLSTVRSKADAVCTNLSESQDTESKNSFFDVKRKRGRPRKVKEEAPTAEQKIPLTCDNIAANPFCHDNDPPNVSPDSGILSSHNSPSPSPRRTESEDGSLKPGKSKFPAKLSPVPKRGSRSKSKCRAEPDKRDRSVSSEASVRRKTLAAISDCKVEIPSPIPRQESGKAEKKKNENKLDIAALDRMLYATDRVLYPPRRKAGRPPQSKTVSAKRGPGRPPKTKPAVDSGDSDDEALANRSVLSEVYAKRKDLNKLAAMPKKSGKSLSGWRDNRSDQEGGAGDDPLDPSWREIDLNLKYKDILSGYKSDHEVKSYKSCSRIIESGYKSDYGFKSGYKSDHCCKSGYKTDHKSGYKSDKSGYKSDHSVRNMRRKMRKLKKSRSVRDRSYYKNQKYFVSEQEILLLANKTFSCLTLGHSTSDSDSECRTKSSYLPSKFTGIRNSGAASSKITFGLTNRLTPLALPSVTKVDLFAPAPVFSGSNSRLNTDFINYGLFNSNNRLGFNKTNRHSFGSLFTSNMSAFTHKFACPPISTPRNDTFSMLVSSPLTGKGIPINNNTVKQPCRNISPKTKKSQKPAETIYPVFKKEKSPTPVVNLFPQSQSSYVPNKSLSRNVFLNVKKPQKKSSSHWKKHKTQLVITPTKCHIPKSNGRLSRMSSKSSAESKRHRHKSKKTKKRRRSRSASRTREVCAKSATGVVDQKFCQEMENLISHFMKLSHAFPKPTAQQSKISGDKTAPESVAKGVKRASKKRKGLDNAEAATPTSKRRHKKQFQESQSKGGKEKDTSANEHKLPLKKRHYHINPSTNNSLSLSLVATEFVEDMKTENAKGSDPFLCTETDCPGDLKDDPSKDKPVSKANLKMNAATEKAKKDASNKNQEHHANSESGKNGSSPADGTMPLHIDVSGDNCNSLHVSPASVGTDDEFTIKKPVGEHSELSKKIYEASEKLKAVNRMVHDLEKSLPKTKESEVGSKDSKSEISKTTGSKSDNKNANSASSTGSPANAAGTKHSPPVVTPKKRHRLEVDKLANAGLDLVVQSLSKKLSDDKVLHLDKNTTNDKGSGSRLTDSQNSKNQDDHGHRHSSNSESKRDDKDSGSQSDSVKSGSSRSMSKNLLPPAQKSEIITRKKNRLEGLTSNLVSKINPSSATKVLDTLMSNNLRKSIESRILERSKTGSNDPHEKSLEGSRLYKDGFTAISTRATVIKSPISKAKLPAEAKKLPKGTDILIEETVVYNYDKPTGIFEPSVDIELQIPKSSISVNHVISDSSAKGGSKASGKPVDSKNGGKVTRVSLEGENQIPMVSLPNSDKSKKVESIASVISDKIQESGHNLRHSKRNHSNDSEEKSDSAVSQSADKKKKKSGANLLRESKLKLVSKPLQNKIQQERAPNELPKSEIIKPSEIENIAVKNSENIPLSRLSDSSIPLKKRAKRRKTINRTGFPSIKKKKKKFNPPTSAEDELINENNMAPLVSLVPLATDLVSKSSSAFDRVPKIGEATNTFVERTTRKKHGELKVVLNKDECPKQGRVSVIALERLQGKAAVDNNNISIIKPATLSSSAQTIVTAVANIPDISLSTKTPLTINTEPAMLDSVAKWEILSETDSLPPLSSGSIGNDPEDSIPLSLLNFKSERPNSGLEQKTDRSKRKLREVSPCDSIENVSLSKRAIIERGLKSKATVVIGDNTLMKRLTRRNDTPTSIDTDDAPLISTVNKNKQNTKYAGLLKQSRLDTASNDTTEETDNSAIRDSSAAPRIVQRRKSRSCNIVKRLRDMSPSSRDSSLETVKTIKKSPKSRDASVETVKHLQDNCLENDPLPLQEKEIDFEKSIDVLSKSIISKKRIMSSRDDSPASSVERGYRSEREKGSTKRNPKVKKKYLVAGLFSDYYKVNDPKPVDPKAKLVYKSADHPNGLVAPPPYCERWVRQRKLHFTLPYDIWWQHQYNQPVPSWNYRKIRTNVYYDVKPTPDGCESQACSCPPSSECQDDCINRMVYAECSPQLCPCKDLCKNQRIQRHEIAPGLDKFMTENKGWGVRTKMPIINGTFILEYVGEVVSDKEFKDRMASRYVKDTHHYCLHLDGGLVIDGHRMGGEGRFVNHSCQPNCEMQKWSVNGLFRMALFALRDIKSGEELTYDYNFSLFNPAEGQACKCDSENCRGVIGGKSQRITKSVVKSQVKTSTTSVSVGTSTVPPSTAANQSQANPSNVTPNRVGRPRKAIKTNMKPNGQSNVIVNVNSPERNDALSFMKEVQHASSRFWQEPQMKPLTNKEKLMVKDRHCFLHRNLDKVRRIRERMLSHPALAASQQLLSNIQPSASQIMACNASGVPNSSAVLPSQSAATNANLLQHNMCNPSVFLTRLHALRTPRNIRTRRLARAEDNPELSKHARLANVFRELYNLVINAKDDKGDLLCTPLLRRKASRNAESNSSPQDLTTIQGNIETGQYKTIALFDSHFNSLFTTIIKTLGRTSSQGIISQQLRKLYNNAKLDFAEQLSTILGPDEPLPQGFLQKRKQEEVILCVCGLHGEEGLMVQCGGEGDQNQNQNGTNPPSPASTSKVSDTDNGGSVKNNPKPAPSEGCSTEQESSSAGTSAASDVSKNTMKGCGVWQHARCMAVTDIGEPYYCHRCQPREVNLEISLDEYTDEGHQFYLSLLRGDLQVRQGDTVYVLRDIPVDELHPDCSSPLTKTQAGNAKEGANAAVSSSSKPFNKRIERSKKGKSNMTDKDKDKGGKEKNTAGKSGDVDAGDSSSEVRKHTYKTIGAISVSELDIFRVERLWKDSATGQRYVYGHHYLRPHETYHEPTRKFFPNEVMRVPLYEAVPIELVMSQCWVMDLNTFCKGRPLAAKEEHVYICELRVDKCARLFTKISRPKYPVCTKSYAFEMFPQRLKITRTYAPHEVSPSLLKNRPRKENTGKSNQEKQAVPVTHQHPALPAPKPKGAPLLHAPIVKTRATQKSRLNNILLKLLSKMPTKQPLDMSYLLDGRRQRKKMISS